MKRKWILGKPFIPCDVKSQTKTYFLVKREKKKHERYTNRFNSKSSDFFYITVSTLFILLIRKARSKKKLHRLRSQIGRTCGSLHLMRIIKKNCLYFWLQHISLNTTHYQQHYIRSVLIIGEKEGMILQYSSPSWCLFPRPGVSPKTGRYY